MSVMTFEAVVENGRILVPADVSIPENAKVYVVVPEQRAHQKAAIMSPKLVNPEQAKDFVKTIVEVTTDAKL